MDVRRFVVRRKVTKAGKKDRFKAPKVQRLVNSTIRARRLKKVKVAREALKASATQRREYLTLISRQRMVARQRKNAMLRRQKSAIERVNTIAFKKAAEQPKKAAAVKKVVGKK